MKIFIADGLPFAAEEFDIAYNCKGPTSAYPELKRIVKEGGAVLGLHPGDQSGLELPACFPELFKCSIGTPILDKINKRLEESSFSNAEIEVVDSIGYLHAPIDGVKLRGFGQNKKIHALSPDISFV